MEEMKGRREREEVKGESDVVPSSQTLAWLGSSGLVQTEARGRR
jgi:hypothetical protein